MKQAVLRILTPKAKRALNGQASPSPSAFCFSQWGDNPVHQCVRAPRHNGSCRCACGADRSAT